MEIFFCVYAQYLKSHPLKKPFQGADSPPQKTFEKREKEPFSDNYWRNLSASHSAASISIQFARSDPLFYAAKRRKRGNRISNADIANGKSSFFSRGFFFRVWGFFSGRFGYSRKAAFLSLSRRIAEIEWIRVKNEIGLPVAAAVESAAASVCSSSSDRKINPYSKSSSFFSPSCHPSVHRGLLLAWLCIMT